MGKALQIGAYSTSHTTNRRFVQECVSRLTLDKGRIVEGNFDGYEVLRLDEMPAVEVHIVPSEAKPSGGEAMACASRWRLPKLVARTGHTSVHPAVNRRRPARPPSARPGPCAARHGAYSEDGGLWSVFFIQI